MATLARLRAYQDRAFGRIGECGDARLTIATAMIDVEQVVVLDALKDRPARVVFVGQVKRVAQPVEVDAGVAAAGGFGDHFP